MPAILLRSDLKTLARVRLKEAKQLLDSGHFSGSYYITGLAVECAIKACIARNIKRYQFPDKNHARDCFEHDPKLLIKTSGLQQLLSQECTIDPAFDMNWTIVKDWNVARRYDPLTTEYEARAIYGAVSSTKHGVMQWLRRHW